MGQTDVYLIYTDGHREHVATFPSGISKMKGGKALNLRYTKWLIDNEEWLMQVASDNPGTRIEIQESE